MSNKSNYINSPSYRKAPTSRVEFVIGLVIILTIFMSVIIGSAVSAPIGFMMFAGALIAYVAVSAARHAR